MRSELPQELKYELVLVGEIPWIEAHCIKLFTVCSAYVVLFDLFNHQVQNGRLPGSPLTVDANNKAVLSRKSRESFCQRLGESFPAKFVVIGGLNRTIWR